MLTCLEQNNDADNEGVHIVVCADRCQLACAGVKLLCVLTLIWYHDISMRLPGYSLFSCPVFPVSHISISDITTVTLISTTTVPLY